MFKITIVSIITIAIFCLFSSFHPFTKEIDENIYCEIRCCWGNNFGDNSIKFTEEGLICNTFKNNKKRTLFIDYLKLKTIDIDMFQEFLERNNFFNYDSVYSCDKIILDGILQTVVLRKRDTYKVISYNYCYHQKLDSIYYFMNKLVPKNKKDLYYMDFGYFDNKCRCD